MCSGTMRVITPTSAPATAREIGHLAHLGDADLQHGHLLRRRQAQEGDRQSQLVVEALPAVRSVSQRRRRRSPAAPCGGLAHRPCHGQDTRPVPPAPPGGRPPHLAGCSTSNSRGSPALRPPGRALPGREVQHGDAPRVDRRQEVLRDAGDEGALAPLAKALATKSCPSRGRRGRRTIPRGASEGLRQGARTWSRRRTARRPGAAQPRLPPSARPGGGPGRRRRAGQGRRRLRAAGSLSHSLAGAGRPGPPPARPRGRCAGGRPGP